jgi:hypothetical protein
MNHNERTGAFGTPQFYNYGNTPQLFTHFDGITAVPGSTSRPWDVKRFGADRTCDAAPKLRAE